MVASRRVVSRFTYGTVHGPLSTCHITLLKALGVLATANVLIIEPCPPANAAQEWVSTPSWDNQVPSPGNGQLGGWESLGQSEAVLREAGVGLPVARVPGILAPAQPGTGLLNFSLGLLNFFQ